LLLEHADRKKACSRNGREVMCVSSIPIRRCAISRGSMPVVGIPFTEKRRSPPFASNPLPSSCSPRRMRASASVRQCVSAVPGVDVQDKRPRLLASSSCKTMHPTPRPGPGSLCSMDTIETPLICIHCYFCLYSSARGIFSQHRMPLFLFVHRMPLFLFVLIDLYSLILFN
jgi:hypothetical protein